MSIIAQTIVGFILELIALLGCVFLFVHKDADDMARFSGLFGIIGISLVILIEVGLTVWGF